MSTDYLAWKITKHLENLSTLANNDDSSVSSAAFHYLETTCQDLNKERPKEFRNQWNSRVKDYGLRAMAGICEQPDIQLEQMPLLAMHLSFKFTLAKPFLSRDDDPFYIIDNPVKKDKVFKLPYVSPSSYKGALRSAARYADTNADLESIIERLFGTDKERETESLKKGRLHFFPTFFSSAGVEVINPHDRKSGAGTFPILFETANGEGQFNLLYFPFDFDQSPQAYKDVADDLALVAQAVRAMFTIYGFGAKTSSGFGTADVIKEGKLRMRLDAIPESKPPVSEPMPNDLAEFFTPERALKNFSEAEVSQWNKRKNQRYEKAKKWLERTQAAAAVACNTPAEPVNPITEHSFGTWEKLIEAASQLAIKVEEGGRS